MQLKCKLYSKLKKGKPLEPYDLELISKIAKKELRFLVKTGIPLTPQNYERWFKVFCYITEKNQEYSRDEILKIYEAINKEEKHIDDENKEIVIQNIIESLREEVDILIKTVDSYGEKITQKESAVIEKREEVEDESIKELLGQIVYELQDIKKQNELFKERIEIQSRKINELNDELERVKSEASIDHLTKLLNKKSFEEILQEYFKLYKKRGEIFSVILIDLDNFKSINDNYGHIIGDEVLKHVASLLKQYLREKDIVARVGGEEFAILLPGVDITVAYKIADRLRTILENRLINIDKKNIRVTASFGIIEIHKGITSVKELMSNVDRALYRAKKEGRNRVVIFQD